MKEKLTLFFEKIEPVFNKISSNVYLQAISESMMATLGPIFVGSIAILLVVLPGQVPQLSFISNFASILQKLHKLTVGAMALYVVALIAYNLTKKIDKNESGITVSVIALICFLLMSPMGTIEDGTNAIPVTWLGAQGVFSAMIIGLVSARLFLEIKRRKWVIKMPEGVPAFVAKIFESLVPTIMIITLFAIIGYLFESTSYGSMHQFIYSIIQVPLQGLGNSIVTLVIVSIISQLLWFFGIHGGNVIGPLINPVLMAMDAQNLTAFVSGDTPPFITGYAFYSIITWGGTSLGLVLLMLRARSKQYREVGKLSLVPILFGVGEPVVFGTPLVLNFKLVIPLITNNAINLIIAYLFVKFGIVSVFSGAAPVFGLPLGVYAAFQGSISVIILHLVLQLIVNPILWYPWFKRLDQGTYKNELGFQDKTANLE